MSTYRDRRGQRVGSLEVLADHGRTKRGEAIWNCMDHGVGRVRYLRSYAIARLAKRAGLPVPPVAELQT